MPNNFPLDNDNMNNGNTMSNVVPLLPQASFNDNGTRPFVSPSSVGSLATEKASSSSSSKGKGAKKPRGGKKAASKKQVPALRAPDGTLVEKPKRKFDCKFVGRVCAVQTSEYKSNFE